MARLVASSPASMVATLGHPRVSRGQRLAARTFGDVLQPGQRHRRHVSGDVDGHGEAGLTVAETRGFGRQRRHTEVCRGTEDTIELIPKVRLDIVVDDDRVTEVVDPIVEAARTDR
jgi:hypothetical protein